MTTTALDRLLHCPQCLEPVPVDPGGWATRYTQILLHLDRCASGLRQHDRLVIARELVPPKRNVRTSAIAAE